jgi:hypothetical protein
VGELAERIQGFRDSRDTLTIDRVGTGLIRALYATYVSYLPVDTFSPVPKYGDPRGVFVEMLKTSDSGQFSYFTAHRESAWRALPSHEDGEVPGDQGPGALQIPACRLARRMNW